MLTLVVLTVEPGAPRRPGLQVVVGPDQNINTGVPGCNSRLRSTVYVSGAAANPAQPNPSSKKTKARLQTNYSVSPHPQFLERASLSKHSHTTFEIAA